MRPLASSMACALACALSACAGSDVALDARFAPEIHDAPHATVSVLGVLKSGRLSADAWLDLAPSISAPFGSAACAAAFDSALVEADPELAKAVDRHARENGVTEPLLSAFGPSAEGDLILVIQTSGQLPTKTSKRDDQGPMPAAPPMGMGPGGGARRGLGQRNVPQQNVPPWMMDDESKKDALEMSASLFSVKLGRSVGVVTLRYTGQSVADAVRRFVEKLGASLPGTRCVGWRTQGRPTPEDVHALRVE